MESSLTESNKMIDQSSLQIMMALKNNWADPTTHSKSMIWYPKAEKVRILTQNLYSHIELLKNNQERKKINSLFDSLINYRRNVLAIDSVFVGELGQIITHTANYPENTIRSRQLFELLMRNKTTEGLIAVLTKFQNSVKIIESRLLQYCYEQTVTIVLDCFENFFSGIVSQNSTVFKPGETIEIFAGVGNLTLRGNPEILINGRRINIGADGAANYKRKVSLKPGKYSIPIKWTYHDQAGNLTVIENQVAYEVAKPCNEK